MRLPGRTRLQKAWRELQEVYEKRLAVHEVKLPLVEHYADTAKSLWLAVLYLYRDREVHKNEISAVARRDIPGLAADQQVRHLKRDGWNIGDKPGLHQLDPFGPSPEFLSADARKRARLRAEDFSALKKAYRGRCATCGAQAGKPSPRYGDEKVQLQQAHRDPHKPGDDVENIIPQCQFCNRAYRDDFVFDDRGRAIAVASVNPVKRAERHVQRKIWDWLDAQFNE